MGGGVGGGGGVKEKFFELKVSRVEKVTNNCISLFPLMESKIFFWLKKNSWVSIFLSPPMSVSLQPLPGRDPSRVGNQT